MEIFHKGSDPPLIFGSYGTGATHLTACDGVCTKCVAKLWIGSDPTMYFTSYHISRQSKTDSLRFTLQFCFPASQISRLDESFQKIIRHFVPNIWECEKVRLCDLSLRVIFVWPGQLIWFCFSVSQISRLSKSFQKNICHCVSNIWECEKVRVCDLNMRVIFVWAGQLLQFCFGGLCNHESW